MHVDGLRAGTARTLIFVHIFENSSHRLPTTLKTPNSCEPAG